MIIIYNVLYEQPACMHGCDDNPHNNPLSRSSENLIVVACETNNLLDSKQLLIIIGYTKLIVVLQADEVYM